jgi:ankyrin repeat protein
MDPTSLSDKFTGQAAANSNNAAAPKTENTKTPEDIFFAAIGDNRYEEVLRLINAGTNVNMLNAQRQSPLCLAVEKRHKHIARLLLKSGADVAKYEQETGTSLLVKMREADTNIGLQEEDIVSLLVDRGAKVQTYVGSTPLLVKYAELGMAQAAQAVLAAGADPNLPGAGRTRSPLIEVLTSDKPRRHQILKSLLAAGALVDGDPNGNSTPLFTAVNKRDAEAVDILLAAGAKTEIVKNNFDGTPLLKAVRDGQKDIAEKLLAGGANVNAVFDQDITLLQRAIRHEAPEEMISFLLEHKADPNTVNTDIGTALHMAIRSKLLPVVNLLLRCEADPLRENAKGLTPLQMAIAELGSDAPIVDRLKIADGAARMAREAPKPTPPKTDYRFYGQ